MSQDLHLILLSSTAVLVVILWGYVWHLAKMSKENRKLSEEEQWVILWERYIKPKPWPERTNLLHGVTDCLIERHASKPPKSTHGPSGLTRGYSRPKTQAMPDS